MAYAGFTKEGTVDESSLLVGDWSEILGIKGGSDYQLGNCPEGVLEMSREYYEHVSTRFPRIVDLVVPVRAGMKFTGRLEEIHMQNVSMLLGQELDPTGNYVYHGALETTYYFTLVGKRTRISDGVAIDFRIHKVLVNSSFSLGGGDESQGAPFEVTGMDDQDGDYGGTAQSPLGWIWVPDMGA